MHISFAVLLRTPYYFDAMNRLSAWIQASRPASQSYIAFPIVLGQMIAATMLGRVDWPAFVLAQLFGLFDQLYIVYANDWADVETDRKNTTFNMFSGGSRAIVEGKLSRRAVGRAAIVCVTLALVTGAGLWLRTGSPAPLLLIATGVLLLYGYSFPPLRLSYRGGGETLQMLGVGGVLPLVGFTAQGGTLGTFPWAVLAITLPISLGCAIATSLPDEPSDRLSNKRTVSVLLGVRTAQIVALVLATATVLAWLILAPANSWVIIAAVAFVPAFFLALALPKTGSDPGTRGLTSLVTRFVAANVLFFLTASVGIAAMI